MNEERVIQKLLEIDGKLNHLATNERLGQLEDRMNTQFDEQAVILQRLDQESVFTLDRVRQIEVEQIKLQLKIA